MLYLDHTASLGGAEIALTRLLAQLRRDQFTPLVLVGSGGPLVRSLELASVPVCVVAIPSRLGQLPQRGIGLNQLFNPVISFEIASYIGKLISHVRSSGTELIHANSLKMCILGGLGARAAGRPNVWQVHSVVGAPMVSPTGVALFRLLARSIPDHIICNSLSTAAALGVDKSRVSVIPCGVNPIEFSFQSRRPFARRPRIGMIARFSPLKGQDIFLDAVGRIDGRHRSAEFVLAGAALFGEGDYERDLHRRANALTNSERVQFLGFVQDAPRLLSELDIVVHASTAPEGFGQSVVEAMMSGKAIVASSAGATSELIEDGVTGRLVPPGDAGALAEAIGQLLDSPEDARQMGERAREVAMTRYDIRKTTRAIEDVYQKVLARV